jgi:hypothetical protein
MRTVRTVSCYKCYYQLGQTYTATDDLYALSTLIWIFYILEQGNCTRYETFENAIICMHAQGYSNLLLVNSGDHSAHVAGLHFPQLFYYVSFLTFFALPFMVDAKIMKTMVKQLQSVSPVR